jgi:cyclase
MSSHYCRVDCVRCALRGFIANAQEDFSKFEIKTEKLADGIYMMTGSGSNLGLAVGPDAVFLIDDQYAPLAPKIQAAIAAITTKPVQFILNTHWHGDHTAGLSRHARHGARTHQDADGRRQVD